MRDAADAQNIIYLVCESRRQRAVCGGGIVRVRADGSQTLVVVSRSEGCYLWVGGAMAPPFESALHTYIRIHNLYRELIKYDYIIGIEIATR